MKRSGTADLPLHYGHVPPWLYERMSKLGFAIVETIVEEYGTDEVVRRLSDAFWFQSLGAVMGMDWHSSGITTSVMGALKRVINPNSKELGIYICGGKGKHSVQTPAELLKLGDRFGLNAQELVHASKLSAKVDNTAIQDGFQLYAHNFIVSESGNWAVVQQGMNEKNKTARRYHWHSAHIRSFVEEPHTAICGINQGEILNLTAREAAASREGIMEISRHEPDKFMRELVSLKMPAHHEVRQKDVNIKRLGSILWLAHEQQPQTFEDLLLLKGVGPRTLQSLTLVSEVIHGSSSRFNDPARFSFAHGGKDGHPFPVPLKVYDETIAILRKGIEKARIGRSEQATALKKLHEIAASAEKNFQPTNNFDDYVQKERDDSWKYGGKTVFGDAQPPKCKQLRLFE